MNRQRLNRILKKISKAYDLVSFDAGHRSYYGETIGGISKNHTMHDQFAAHGSIDGFEISLVKRTFTLQSIIGSDEELSWIIIKAYLPGLVLPRFFLSGGDHDVELIRHLAYRYGNLVSNHHDVNHHQNLPNGLDLFCQRHSAHLLDYYLSEASLRYLQNRYSALSLEVEPEAVYTYLESDQADMRSTNQAIEAALWLANHCYAIHQKIVSDHQPSIQPTRSAALA